MTHEPPNPDRESDPRASEADGSLSRSEGIDDSSPSGHERVLAGDVFADELAEQVAPGVRVLDGEPTAAVTTLGEVGAESGAETGAEVGLWEMAPGTDHDTEVDEVFVVLAGQGTVTFEDGEAIDLAPGVAVRLRAGERTTWVVTETLRKVYVAV